MHEIAATGTPAAAKARWASAAVAPVVITSSQITTEIGPNRRSCRTPLGRVAIDMARLA